MAKAQQNAESPFKSYTNVYNIIMELYIKATNIAHNNNKSPVISSLAPLRSWVVLSLLSGHLRQMYIYFNGCVHARKPKQPVNDSRYTYTECVCVCVIESVCVSNEGMDGTELPFYDISFEMAGCVQTIAVEPYANQIGYNA